VKQKATNSVTATPILMPLARQTATPMGALTLKVTTKAKAKPTAKPTVIMMDLG